MCDRKAAAAAPFVPLLEEKADQVLPDQPWAMGIGANFFEESSGEVFHPSSSWRNFGNLLEVIGSSQFGGVMLETA